MARAKYFYNPVTCNYEKAKIPFWKKVVLMFGFLLFSTLIGLSFLFLYAAHFELPGVSLIRDENTILKEQVKAVIKEMDTVTAKRAKLQDQDNVVYRTIFEVPSTDESCISKCSLPLNTDSNNYLDLIKESHTRLKQIESRIKAQSESYENTLNLAIKHKKRLSSLPAIQPISNQDLKRISCGFGERFHPVCLVMKPHDGMDFVASVGTPVYATGDGVVKHTKKSIYAGNLIEIDHGYGIVTKYAHLHEFGVKEGERVKRGQIIGSVGKTGEYCTGPHLHYVVNRGNKAVDPVNYMFSELTPKQYAKVLELASKKTKSLS